MASGDTKVSICSDALIMLGAAEISSLNEGTDEAKVADRLYDDIKIMALSMYPWSWSFKKTALARSVDAPTNEWAYQYPLPGDIIAGPRALFDSTGTGIIPVTEWEKFGAYIYTDYDTVVIDYQWDVSESLMPSYFVKLLKYMLAWHFAEPVTDQITKAQYWQGVAIGGTVDNGRGGYFRQACMIDGQNQPSVSVPSFSLIEVRN